MSSAEDDRQFAFRPLDLDAGAPQAFFHPDDALEMGLRPDDRVRVRANDQTVIALVATARHLAARGSMAGSVELVARLGEVKSVDVRLAQRPRSIDFIRRKLDGHKLAEDEIKAILEDISHHRLSPIEVTAWATGTYVHELDDDEIVWAVHAMVTGGARVEFDRGPVMDVHSIGGVPGNKYAPLAVSIVASQGLLIPKTSSRAISSACGTPDFMEVLCPVEMTADRIKAITQELGGVLAWGGGVNLAPADDQIIRVEYPLGIDPRSQLLASVLAKKLAVGARRVVIDVPVGPQAKVPSDEHAHRLGRRFVDIGRRLDMDIQVIITDGSQPVGHAVGPILEAREALATRMGDGPKDLVEKSVDLAGRLLEMGGAAQAGHGLVQARRALADGSALATFRKIIGAQGGDPDVQPEDLVPGPLSQDILSPHAGMVEDILTDALVAVARAAGSPRDKGAGVWVHRKRGHRVKEGEPLLTLYSEHAARLRHAVAAAVHLVPVRVEGMVVRGVVS